MNQFEYENEKRIRKLRRKIAHNILEESKCLSSNEYSIAVTRYIKSQEYLRLLYRDPDEYKTHYLKIEKL